MNYFLTEEQEMLKELCAQIAREKILPVRAEYDESGEFPWDVVKVMAASDIYGVYIPEEYGGFGGGVMEMCIATEELSKVCGGISLAFAASALGAYPILLFGSDEQKKKYLPDIAAGKKLAAFGLTEANAGSDAGAVETRAELDGDEYVLNGSKMWITNAPGADVIIVYAKTDPGAGTKGVSAFLIERGTPGFSTPQKLDKLGMRGSDTSEVLLENCRIPAANLMAEEGKGAAILMSGLDYERVVLAGGSLGIMAACMDLVMPYVHDRKQFGQPIGEFQLMQGKIADMYTAMNSCRAYVYAVAQACDRGLTTRFDAAGCILVAAEKATWMAGEAIQALGGNGYINEYPAGRLWRDAKLYEIGAGTSEIRRMLIGRELFNATK